MPSERIQRQIERFLDDAESAANSGDWSTVAEKARAVLSIETTNEDAQAFLTMAEANLGSTAATATPAPTPSPVPLAPAIPESFAAGRYHVRKFLGEGGKKRVFLAHDALLDRDVAFALIKTDGLDDVGRQRITREAQAMGRMGTHPHVVSIFDIGEEGGAPYVVTELLGGGDVEGMLEKTEGPLPLARALQVAKDVCDGLVFAHAQGIVHRDLKPGNVWLTADGIAKIGDFGLAVALNRSRLTMHGLMVGTVAYMPPEQALGGEVTPQSDLYSLGAMLYELVTGKPPFAGDSPTAVISQHINTPPVAPSWNSDRCPPDLEDLILRLLAKVPAGRPASAREVLAALERVDPEAKSASHSDSSANPLDRLARGVFVGRERELERLRTAFDEAFAGRGSVVMLVGEPGIGKTRTTQELETYARMRGAKAFWGRTQESGGAPPFWPWVQVGRGYRDQMPEETRRAQWQPYAVELQRIFPGLRDLFPNLPEPPPVDSEDAQFALFDAWSSFLRSVSQDQPLLVVLDDLHWADRPTLRMLSHLARDLSHARVLVLGTYRDTDLDRTHPLSQALAEMNRESLFARIPLRGLSESETATYIRDTAGVAVPAELSRRVHTETEGNPFFLSEVVRLMSEEGAFTPGATSAVTIPEGVKEALGRRLDRLSPEANDLLSVASVVGRECSHELLGLLTTHDDDTLLALVEEALRARVFEETGTPGEYRFTHALMQDALYSELSTARRVRMHGRVAETLERLWERDLPAHAAELARHFDEAAVMNRALTDKALRYSQLAGEQAEAALAWDDAARHYTRCIALVRDSGDAEADEAGLLISLAVVERRSGGVVGGVASFAVAVERYRARGDFVALARGFLRVVDLGTSSADLLQWRPLMDEVIAALGETDSLELCRMLGWRARFDFEASGDAFAERAAAMAARLRLPADVTDRELVGRRATMLLGRGEFAEAVELLNRIYTGDLANPGRSAAAPLNNALGGLLALGDVTGAVANRMKYLEFAQAHHQTTNIAIGASDLAYLVWCQGAHDEYQRRLQNAGEFGQANGLRSSVALIAGDPAQALRLLPAAGRSDIPLATAGILIGLRVRILLATGDRERAEGEFGRWMEWWRSATVVGFSARGATLGMVGDALCELGDESLRREVLAYLSSFPVLRAFPTFAGAYGATNPDDLCGRLALSLGLPLEEAEQHFQTGLEWSSRPDVRFVVDQGRCLQGLAEVAERRGDHALAARHLDAAGELFAQYGAKLYLDQVLAKKQFLKA